MSGTLILELDEASATMLQSLAKSWHVAPQEAVKRAVSAAAENLSPGQPTPLEAFRQLQAAVQLTPEQAEAWKHAVVDARR